MLNVSDEQVHHPAHYQTAAGIEAIDVTERYGFHRSGHLFDAMHYLLRAGRKDPGKLVEDLRKAEWWMMRWADTTSVDLEAPMAEDGALAWATPAQIVAAFALEGPRAAAVTHLLQFALEDLQDADNSGVDHFNLAHRALEEAIADASQASAPL